MKLPINNLEQLSNAPANDQVITLKTPYKSTKTIVQPCPDGFGWYKGIPRVSDDEKRGMVYCATPKSKYVLKDGVTFDLSQEAHKATWEWVKHTAAIAKDFDSMQFSEAEFYPFVEEVESKKNVSKKLLKFKAAQYIMSDNIINYPMRALLLGVNMKHERPVVIQEFLLEAAETSPERVIDAYESADMSAKLLLLKALDKGLIVKDGTMYRFGTNLLGITHESCVSWIKDSSNKHVVEAIERELNPDYISDASITDGDTIGSDIVETPEEKAAKSLKLLKDAREAAKAK